MQERRLRGESAGRWRRRRFWPSRVSPCSSATRRSRSGSSSGPPTCCRNSADAQVRAGSMLLLTSQFEDAKSRASKALAIEPANASAMILRGNARWAGLREIADAIAQVQGGDQDRPRRQRRLLRPRRAAVQANGDSTTAERSFRKASSRSTRNRCRRDSRWPTSSGRADSAIRSRASLKRCPRAQPAKPRRQSHARVSLRRAASELPKAV